MTTLANITITTAVTGFVTQPMQFLEGPPLSLSVEANFTYGCGGASVDAWLQTSLDGGTTWCDMAECSFTTASAREGASIPSSTAITPVVATDGTLAANSINAGLFGARWRVKYNRRDLCRRHEA
jgi:hypothetical protein